MNKIHNISFAKQLTFYLLSALFITFILITIALTNSLDQFIHNNAYEQSKIFTNNVFNAFDQQMGQLENIPNNIEKLTEGINNKNATQIPARILNGYPSVAGCTIYYNPQNPQLRYVGNVCAMRHAPINTNPAPYHLDSTQIVKRTQADCNWVISAPSTLSLYAKLHDNSGTDIGMIKMDFPLATMNIYPE